MRTLAVVALATLSALLGLASPAPADQQTAAQRACVTKLNRAGADVARAVARNFVRCVRQGLSGNLPAGQSAAQCLGADDANRVADARARTMAAEASDCVEAPGFGAASAVEVNAAFASLLRPSAAFGSDLDAALVAADGSPSVARCQLQVARLMLRTVDVRLRGFDACKRFGLALGLVRDGGQLAQCCGAGTARMARLTARFTDRIATQCAGVDIAAAFPGECAGETAAAR